MNTVAVIGERPGSWHGRALAGACAGLGMRAYFVPAESGVLQAGDSIEVAWPRADAVLVRGIPGGSLEQVMLRLNRLYALELAGLPVCNPPRVIERTVDKAHTQLLLSRAGLPVPRTWVVESRVEALAILDREQRAGRQLVVKPLFGSQGTRVRQMHADETEPAGVYYLQTRIDAGGREWRDLRVFVAGGRARAATWRCSRYWVTNRARGGRCEAARLEPEAVQLAEAAVRAVGADYAGVDLLPDAAGRLWLLEVNSVPAWKGLQALTRTDIAGLIVEGLAARMARAAAAGG